MKQWTPRLHVGLPTFRLINIGEKKILVRMEDRILVSTLTGQEILIVSGDITCCCRVVAKRRYKSLEALLQTEDLEGVAHGKRWRDAHLFLEHLYDTIPQGKTIVAIELVVVRPSRSRHAR